MKNIQSPVGERGFSLLDLKAKEVELEDALKQVKDAIQVFDKLEKSGIFPKYGIVAETPLFEPLYKQGEFADLSVYEGAVSLLMQKKQSLTTDEIVDGLINGGKKIGDNARVIVATTLYKSVKKKKNCKIAVAGTGKWKLA